jgi:hypothetical protein
MADRVVALVVILLGFAPFLHAQDIPPEWLTDYERSGGMKTPRYAETIEFCRRLEKASPWIKVATIGKTPEGRDQVMVIASTDGTTDPAAARASGKAILLVQNGIHAGEIDGKDACLMLLRDIAITKTKAALLDHVILLIIPVFNVDGHERFGRYNRINQNGPEEMGWRVTAQNLNLNRDYMKADAPEMQAWLRMYNAWLPDFFVDCHVTDGADYQYVVTYSIESGVNVAEPVRRWINSVYLPDLRRVKTAGIPVTPYVDFRDDYDPAKGLQGGTAPPRFSTIYVTLHNRPGLLIETHMLKEYKKRVEGTSAVLQQTLALLNREYRSLRESIDKADASLSTRMTREIPLQMTTIDTPSSVVRFLGYKQSNEQSDISGRMRRIYSREPMELDIPRYDSLRVTKAVTIPAGYLIPQQWQEVIGRMRLHGIRLQRLTRPEMLEAEVYTFSTVKWQQRPFEGRLSLSYAATQSRRKSLYPAGTVYVDCAQPAAAVAVHLLEPDAPDALVQWGFFNTIFEQKEYAEDYVLEDLSRTMLAADPELKRTFETRLRTDTLFAKNPRARLQYFYERSPFWDQQLNVYPVTRLLPGQSLDAEPLP